MNSSPNYTEWSREEKEELAKRRMDEMRLKNEKLLQRYAEVENDRIKAESLNSAITGATKAGKKEKNLNPVESSKEETRVEHAREWDRGKPDKEHWKSPEHHGSSFKNYRSSGRNRRDNDRRDNWGSFSRNENSDRARPNRGTDGRHDVRDNYDDDGGNWGQNSNSYERRNADKKDTWGGYSKNESTDHYKSHHVPESRKPRGNYRYKQNDNQHGSSRPQISPKRTRGVGYRNSDSHRKPQYSYSDDKFKRTDYNRSNSRKKYSYRAHSRSTSRSGSDHVENQFTIRAYNLWQNDKISEDQSKQNRVEKWVKSVNKTNMWGDKQFSQDQKEKNTNKFVQDQKDKTTAKVFPEQKDRGTGQTGTKFERYENNPIKSSEEEYGADLNIPRGNKSYDNNYTSQHDYHEIRSQNKGVSYNAATLKQIGEIKKKSMQTKRSPQYSSGSSTRNEHFRKQRRFDSKGMKNDDDRNRYKPKMYDNTLPASDSWKNSGFDSSKNKTNSGSKLDNRDKWNDDDDGIWGNADQSHIKWKISDDELDVQETKQNIKETKKNTYTKDGWNTDKWNTDTWNTGTKDGWEGGQITSDVKSSRSKEQSEEKKEVPFDNDDGIWSNVEQTDIHWKTETETFSQDGQIQNWEYSNSNTAICSAVKEVDQDVEYGWQCEQLNQSNVKDSSEGNKELKTSDQKAYDSDPNKSNISESHAQDSQVDEDAIVTQFERSVCISDEKSINVSVNYFPVKHVASDDGGWSTVSEGDANSDDQNVNKNKKL